VLAVPAACFAACGRDYREALVLAAHWQAPGVSALQCARLTGLDRETVTKKKRQLIGRGILALIAGFTGRGWQGRPCEVLLPTVENAEKPATESRENQQLNAGKPAIETAQSRENQQLNPPLCDACAARQTQQLQGLAAQTPDTGNAAHITRAHTDLRTNTSETEKENVSKFVAVVSRIEETLGRLRPEALPRLQAALRLTTHSVPEIFDFFGYKFDEWRKLHKPVLPGLLVKVLEDQEIRAWKTMRDGSAAHRRAAVREEQPKKARRDDLTSTDVWKLIQLDLKANKPVPPWMYEQHARIKSEEQERAQCAAQA